MAPLAELHGDALAVVAARVGAVRLIDNALIHVRDGLAAPGVTNPDCEELR